MNPVNSIKDIGEMVGYNDSNYFTRVFKRIEGITPTEYRNKKCCRGQKVKLKIFRFEIWAIDKNLL